MYKSNVNIASDFKYINKNFEFEKGSSDRNKR